MDPFTLIAGATAIYNSIKSAVDSGRDMMETAEKVGNLFSKVAQIVTITSTPQRKKLFQSQAEYEADAVKRFAVKAKAQDMQLQVKNLFIGQYGRPAWDAIQREIIEMRKEAARQAAAALKEQEENRKDLIMVSGIVGFLVLGIGTIGVILMFTVK
jgi:preprotein translocase subunit Sss1